MAEANGLGVGGGEPEPKPEESVDFIIKCEDIAELVRLQKMLGVKNPSIRCDEFMARMA